MVYKWEMSPTYADIAVINIDMLMPMQQQDEEDIAFIKNLKDIVGIEQVEINSKYSMAFVKGAVFNWDDIKPNILKIFQSYYCKGGGEPQEYVPN